MALTLQQWHDKIEKFVPRWYFEEIDGLADAVFWGVAAVFHGIQQDVDDQQAATFITESEAPILDLLGDERSIIRNPGEGDPSYAGRIQSGLFVSVGLAELQTVVNAALNNGPAFFIENLQYGYYDDPDISETPGFLYYDDYYSRWLDLTKWYNWWTVIIPEQTAGDANIIKAAVISGIESNKAFGTTYDILYGDEFSPIFNWVTDDGDNIVTDDGDQIIFH